MVRQMVGDEVPLAYDGRRSRSAASAPTSRRSWRRSTGHGRRRASPSWSISAAPRPTARWRSRCCRTSRRGTVVVCNAPIVEGAVMAATEASGGSPLEVVQAHGRRACRRNEGTMKRRSYDDRTAASTAVGAADQRGRPACAPVGEADPARQELRAESSSRSHRDGPWIDAKSPVKVMRVKAPQGRNAAFPRQRRRCRARRSPRWSTWSSATSTRRSMSGECAMAELPPDRPRRLARLCRRAGRRACDAGAPARALAGDPVAARRRRCALRSRPRIAA